MNKLISYILLPALAFFISFSVYAYTLYPSISAGDNTEMVTAAATLGVPHAPGYPINTIIGHLFSKLPIGEHVPWRINLASAFLQSLTVVVFYFLLVALFHLRSKRSKVKDSAFELSYSIVAFCGALFLAFSLIFWQYATKFEVFPLNNLFAVALMLLSVLLFEESRIMNYESRRNGKSWKLSAFAFVFGMSLTHHQTIVLIIPAVLVFLYPTIKEWLGIVAVFVLRFFTGIRRNPIDTKPVRSLLFSLFFLILGMTGYLSVFWIASADPYLNWGQIDSFQELFFLLIRRDFGVIASYLVGFDPVTQHTPAEQVGFYFANVLKDFTIVGVGLSLFGLWFLWKHQKRVLLFAVIGSFTSGFIFLSYANFGILDSFGQATVRRFHMMPNIFLAIVVSYGVLFLYQKLSAIRVSLKEYQLGLSLGKLFLVGIFIYPLFFNFAKANSREDTLTRDNAIMTYSPTPKNALILVSGDVSLMTADYYRLVEQKGGDKRIVFTPGQFHLDWHIPMLKKRYPHLIIPFQRPGKLFTTATQVVEANFGKQPIYLAPDLVEKDPELDQKFTLYPKHGLFLVKQKGESLKLEDLRVENDAMWKKIDLDVIKAVKKKTPNFEETVIFYLQRHFYNTGYVYENVKLYDDAIKEYDRAAQIDPLFKEALSALARVYSTKLEKPDFAKAQEYLDRYLGVLKDDESDNAEAAMGMKEELRQREIQFAIDEEKRIATQSAQVASGSAEATQSADLSN